MRERRSSGTGTSILLGLALSVVTASCRTPTDPVEAMTAPAADSPPAAPDVPSGEEAIAVRIAEFKEYLETGPDPQGLINQIDQLRSLKDKAVVAALMPLVRRNDLDDEVKVAVLRTVGEQGDKAIASKLLYLIDSKSWEEKSTLIAAAIEGVGEADAAGHYNEVMKFAKKYLDTDGAIASAAFQAASRHVTPETVDDFVKELGRADYTTFTDALVKREAREATKPVIVECLKWMTGESFDDVKDWTQWWRENKKSWSPPLSPEDWNRFWNDNKQSWFPRGEGDAKTTDLNASMTFSDPAYHFEITRPNRAWSFRKPLDPGPAVILEASDEGQRAAWVEVHAMPTELIESKTPEAVIAGLGVILEGEFRTLEVAKWNRERAFGSEQILQGMHRQFDAVRMRNLFVVHGGVLYSLQCTFKVGKKASLETDIEEILRTFKLTK